MPKIYIKFDQQFYVMNTNGIDVFISYDDFIELYPEYTDQLDDVISTVINELKKHHINNYKNLTILFIKKVLKKLHLEMYYEDAHKIMTKLSDMQQPSISKEIEEKFLKRFRQIQISLENTIPKGAGFLSYTYIIHKLCLLEGLNDLAEHFPLPKNSEKLQMQDEIWKSIYIDPVCKI